MEEDSQANTNLGRLLMSDKLDFRKRNISEMKRDITYLRRHNNVNVYAPNNRASEDWKPKLLELKGKIDKSIITLADFYPLCSIHSQKSERI